jgi:DNA-directed RNA polymerase specialized sigma24 family protein
VNGARPEVGATKPGTEEAFEQFYRRYQRQVSRYLLGMLVDPALAADASQETWLRYLHFPTDRSEAFAFRRRAFSSPARAGTVDLRWG